MYVLPFLKRWDATKPPRASFLKMALLNTWLDNGIVPKAITAHFVGTSVKNISGFPDVKTILQSKFSSTLKELQHTDLMRQLPYKVSSCVTAIEKYHSCVEKEDEKNEVTVPMIYANAIAAP